MPKGSIIILGGRMKKFFTINDLVKDMNLDVIYLSTKNKDYKMDTSEVTRPGLQLSGFYKKFIPSRLQVIGNAEWEYLNQLDKSEREEKLKDYLSNDISAIVITAGNPVFEDLELVAINTDTTLLRTEMTTSKFINDYYSYSSKIIASKEASHGVLIEVYGMGVFLQGKSGIGKSETALDLVTRGHKLVSDDVVEITRVNDYLEGQSPELTRHFMEIRGVGILDIERLYGVGSVKTTQEIDLVIELENWDSDKFYDRLGFEETYTEILGINIPKITIPMKPGRNTAMIIEVATRNLIQKKLGYNAAEELNKRVLEKIEERKNKN